MSQNNAAGNASLPASSRSVPMRSELAGPMCTEVRFMGDPILERSSLRQVCDTVLAWAVSFKHR